MASSVHQPHDGGDVCGREPARRTIVIPATAEGQAFLAIFDRISTAAHQRIIDAGEVCDLPCCGPEPEATKQSQTPK
jgi:hypothetical protein